MYELEKEELIMLGLHLNQDVRIKAQYKTTLAKAVKNNLDFMSKNNIPVLEIISAIINILDALGIKGRIRRYVKVGKIIISTIYAMKGKRKVSSTKINKYFDVREFLDYRTYKEMLKYGRDITYYVSPKIIAIVTYIREETGRAVMINNWMFGGRLSQRGYRSWWSRVGAKSSAHRKGEGVDISVIGWTPQRTQEFIIDHANKLHVLGLRRVEKIQFTPTWTHLDMKGDHSTIYIFEP